MNSIKITQNKNVRSFKINYSIEVEKD